MIACDRHKEEIQLLLAALPLPKAATSASTELVETEEPAASPQLPAIIAVFLAEAAVALVSPASAHHKSIARLLRRGPLSTEVSSFV